MNTWLSLKQQFRKYCRREVPFSGSASFASIPTTLEGFVTAFMSIVRTVLLAECCVVIKAWLQGGLLHSNQQRQVPDYIFYLAVGNNNNSNNNNNDKCGYRALSVKVLHRS